MKKRT